MYQLYKQLENHNACIVFGASDIGELIFNEISSYCLATSKSLCFADNSYKKIGEVIYKPSEVAQKHPNALWIIASDRHAQSMTADLLSLGVEPENIFPGIPQSILYMKQNEDHIRRITPQGIIGQIEFDVCRHCNLNCSGCSSFSPLIDEPLFADFNLFKGDMERLSYLLNANLGKLLLMGGEPLLHPDINSFAQAARRYFPNTTIKIVTNGIMLENMTEEFWNSCKKNNIVISVTKYPIKLNFEKMRELSQYYEVDFEFFGIAVDKSTWNIAFDCDGRQNPHKSFINCFFANYCVTLNNGKISTCSPILRIDIFNKHFKKDLDVCKSDYIDIYKAETGREILEFLAQPIPFCRYCNVKKRTYDNLWSHSKRYINEWVVE